MEQPAFNDFDLFRNLCAIPSSQAACTRMAAIFAILSQVDLHSKAREKKNTGEGRAGANLSFYLMRLQEKH